MKQTFFSWFSVLSAIVACPIFESSGEYGLQLFDVDVVGGDDGDVDEVDDDIVD